MVARGGIEPPTRGFSVAAGGSRGLSVNHLQRLPTPNPATPRHNPGTPNLSSTHSRHIACGGVRAHIFEPESPCTKLK